MLWLSCLDQFDPAEQSRVFISRNFGLARGWPHQYKGDLARQVTLLPKPPICFSCKWFTTVCKEIVGVPRVARVGGWPFFPGQLFSIQMGLKNTPPSWKCMNDFCSALPDHTQRDKCCILQKHCSKVADPSIYTASLVLQTQGAWDHMTK